MSGVILEIILIENEHSDCPFSTGNQLNYDYVSHTKYFANKLNYFNSNATLVSRLICEKLWVMKNDFGGLHLQYHSSKIMGPHVSRVINCQRILTVRRIGCILIKGQVIGYQMIQTILGEQWRDKFEELAP